MRWASAPGTPGPSSAQPVVHLVPCFDAGADEYDRVMSTLQILTQVWGYDDSADNLVQVHVSALRRKI
ncbi:MAG TPA: helix-turn-helix domain-containing protein [Friedmanniella sp.]